MPDSELKPCPFCGSLPEAKNRSIYRCPNLHTPWMIFDDWNTRTRPSDELCVTKTICSMCGWQGVGDKNKCPNCKPSPTTSEVEELAKKISISHPGMWKDEIRMVIEEVIEAGYRKGGSNEVR